MFATILSYILICSPQSQAMTPIEGIVHRANGSLQLESKVGPLQGLIFKLSATTVSTTLDLLELEDGDYIAGEGTFTNDTAIVDGLFHVGLKKLIGTWQNASVTVRVSDFENAIMISPSSTAYSFRILPTGGKNWLLNVNVRGEIQSYQMHFSSNHRLQLTPLLLPESTVARPKIVLYKLMNAPFPSR